MFDDMTHRTYVRTKFEIVSILINNDSTIALTVLRASNSKLILRMYGLNTNEHFFEHVILGTFMKA